MFIELHVLQNFAPSCLNRDDTNSPKDCQFGGYRRARISSQCLKRSARQHPIFAETIGKEIGIRSRRLLDKMTQTLVGMDREEEPARQLAEAVFSKLIGKIGDNGLSAVAFYCGETEIAAIIDAINENWDDLLGSKGPEATVVTRVAKALTRQFKGVAAAADIALFGRMIADTADLNIDASCQVAHAISTHRAAMEMDYFTAVDDLQPDEEPGAGMIGTVEFTSNCFYRYALVDMEQLATNLDNDADLAVRTLEGFLKATVFAIPSARQNSMAAQNPPSFVMAVVRENGIPWSLANAFEKPVTPDVRGEKGLVAASIEALDTYWQQLCAAYGADGIIAAPVCLLGETKITNLRDNRVNTMQELFETVTQAVNSA